MKLVKTSPEYGEAFLDFNQEFEEYGERHYRIGITRKTLPDFFQGLAEQEIEPSNPAHVPMTIYWLVDEKGRILGEARFRHYLNENLMNEGGHIGYNVRPTARGKGNGTLILEKMLDVARERGLEKVLITCDTDNLHSARIIEKNGGVLDGYTLSDWSGKQVSRYWIVV